MGELEAFPLSIVICAPVNQPYSKYWFIVRLLIWYFVEEKKLTDRVTILGLLYELISSVLQKYRILITGESARGYTRWGISAIILTDYYLCYKETKCPYNFFLILISNEFICLKLRTNGNIERRGALLWTVRTSTFSLRSHRDPFVFSTALRDFQTRKLACTTIWFYVNYFT